jgi:hypothetical protein
VTGVTSSGGSAATFRAGATTVGIDLRGPTADLVKLEAELLGWESRIAREGGQVTVLFGAVRDVVGIVGGPAFVRFARAYIERTPSFSRVSLFVERSFVVRTIIDPISLLAPRISIRTFGALEAATGWARELDPTFSGLVER